MYLGQLWNHWTPVLYFNKIFWTIFSQKLNMEKSVLYWVGPWKQKLISQNISVIIESGSINILGVYIGNDNNKNIKGNFRVKLALIRNNLNMWKFHNLTLIGKNTLKISWNEQSHILNEYGWNPTKLHKLIANYGKQIYLREFPTKS